MIHRWLRWLPRSMIEVCAVSVLAKPVLTGDVGVQSNHDVAWLVSAEPTEFDDAPRVRRR